jgi:3-oxoadipate enol-lactonase
MPFVSLKSSPSLPSRTAVQIYYRESGKGPPLIFLHGGWGYEMYSYERQIAELKGHFRCLALDRSGYGRSPHLVSALPSDFHYQAAVETLSFMDAMGIERAAFWGHSDGAVIAAIIGFTAPARVSGLILEAFHYYAEKISSREFFEMLAERPEALGTELCERFASEHGAEYWRQLITRHAKAWLELAFQSKSPRDDLYGGRLHEITAPTLFVHGRLDPRTEPGEIDHASKQLPHALMRILEQGTHSPHSEAATEKLVTQAGKEFLSGIPS